MFELKWIGARRDRPRAGMVKMPKQGPRPDLGAELAGNCKVTFCRACIGNEALKYNICRINHMCGIPGDCCEVTTYGVRGCNT